MYDCVALVTMPLVLLQTDLLNYCVRYVDVATSTVTTLAGSPDDQGIADGVGANATFVNPAGVALDPSNSIAFIVSPQFEDGSRVLGTHGFPQCCPPTHALLSPPPTHRRTRDST